MDDCVSVVTDYGTDTALSGPTVKTPKLDFQSLDVDWQSLPPKLMYEILILPSRAEEADNIIRGVAEYDYEPFREKSFEERQYQYAELGIISADLATLRKKYNFPEKKYGSWNPINFLLERKNEIFRNRTQKNLKHVVP